MNPKWLAAAGTLLAIVAVLALYLRQAPKVPQATSTQATTTASAPPPTTTAPPPPTTTAPPPKPVPMSWESAGGIVVHTHDADPQWLGQTLRADGFGWVAVFLGQAGTPQAPDPNWIERFQAASGLPVGGWTVLTGNAAADAQFAVSAVKQYGLAFYIADAENPYQADPGRSQQFVAAFRAAEPSLPAGVSSFCDAQGIGLGAWAQGGFAFLPQAYVNDFGTGVAPAVCVRTAAPWFSSAQVHPTVATYRGQQGLVSPYRFARLLAAAGTKGFSVFPAETGMTAQDWQAYGQAIATLHIATAP